MPVHFLIYTNITRKFNNYNYKKYPGFKKWICYEIHILCTIYPNSCHFIVSLVRSDGQMAEFVIL